MIDTHAHLDLEHFGDDLSELLDRCRTGYFPEFVERNIFSTEKKARFSMEAILVPGISAESTRHCVGLAQKHDFLYAAVGIHPNSVKDAAKDDWSVIEHFAGQPKVVAVGETGLDRYWDRTPFEMQLDSLERHIDLAKRKKLPILLHSRDCDADLLPILAREAGEPADRRLRGVIHSFSSDASVAEKCVEYGFYVSFSGAVTYTNRKFAPLWDAAKVVPAERLLLETDSPYLTPHPYRGKLEKNEPLMVAFVARRLAELRGVPIGEIVRQTTENARRLLGNPGKIL